MSEVAQRGGQHVAGWRLPSTAPLGWAQREGVARRHVLRPLPPTTPSLRALCRFPEGLTEWTPAARPWIYE